MPLGSALNSLLLFAKHLDPNRSTVMPVKKLDYDKPVIFPRDGKINFLERDIPENHGYSKEYIDSFFREINSDLSIRANRLIIVKDNKVIGEQYLTPYVKDCWDCVFSSSKTLVSLALGLLYDEGKVDLDLPVCKILKNERTIGYQKNKKITLRHLLTMTTGNSFNEAESASSLHWVKSYFDSNQKFKLGTRFEYNSMNTYIISVIVETLAKCPFRELVQEKIFTPLGISETHLDVSLEGYFKGGWGLYILPEDMAKLGILVSQYGEYNGKRIVSKEWIKMMSSKQFDCRDNGRFDYGFQMWVDEKSQICAFNGMYDQNILVYRRSGIVLVTCCANNEVFQGSNMWKIANKYFSNEKMGEFQLYEYNGNRDIINNDSLLYYYDLIANKDYKPVNRISNSCGILPIILQNEMGTYTKGIKNIVFKKDENNYALCISENRKVYEIKFNFDKGIRQTLFLYGNLYEVACDARFVLNGRGDPYLVIRLYFLEFSSSRYFTVKFGKDFDVVSIEESENPGFDFVMSIIEIQDEPVKKFLRNTVKNINTSYLNGAIRNIFSPSFTAVHGESKINKYLQNSGEKPVTKK